MIIPVAVDSILVIVGIKNVVVLDNAKLVDVVFVLIVLNVGVIFIVDEFAEDVELVDSILGEIVLESDAFKVVVLIVHSAKKKFLNKEMHYHKIKTNASKCII